MQDERSISTTHLTKMQIDTGDSEPVSQRPYPITMKHYDWVKNEINKKPQCTSNLQQLFHWVSTYHCTTQGQHQKYLVIDYRALNKVRLKFVWPLQKVEDIFSKLNGAKYFFTLNLHAGYHHIPLNEDYPQNSFYISCLENMSI